MRYIKLFESFSNIDKTKLKENIEACLVELFDKDFEILTIVDNRYINISIERKGDENEIEGDPNFYTGYDFELYEIEDEIRQVCDYISEMYDNVTFEYIPETRWDNPGYSKLEQIPDGLVLTRFDLYAHVEKSVLRTYESYEQEEDKDWGKDGFETNKEELEKRVEDIFVELVDEGYLVDVEVSFMSIAVSIQLNNENVQSFEENKYIDNELVKDYVETFIEYIKERNKNIDSELGLEVRYELNQGQNAMYRKYIYDYYPEPEYNTIAELKIVLGV
jgi:hypothetical protein